ncbi:MAG: ABC transporter permease [Oscillospiraceae bacterium]|nr:ABC transporter permease [Oscillospiraceae bacterium]
MRTLVFARRTAKEILRDPLSLGFGLGFPVILLLLMTAIQKNIPVSLFELRTLTPGITVFGLSFISLFSATLVAKDRGGSLIARLRSSPMTGGNFIFGYLLPLLPMAVCQMLVSYLVALALGLTWTPRILLSIVVQLPAALFFLAVGLVCGCCFTEKQVGGICGALMTNLSAWLSGAWFDLKLVGGAFETIAYLLPFANATDAGRAALSGDMDGFAKPFLITCIYGVFGIGVAIAVCRRRIAHSE